MKPKITSIEIDAMQFKDKPGFFITFGRGDKSTPNNERWTYYCSSQLSASSIQRARRAQDLLVYGNQNATH